jgi:hypothetical protein
MTEQGAADNQPKYSPGDYFLISKDLVVDSLFTAVGRIPSGPISRIGDVFCTNLLAVQVTATSVWMFARGAAHTAAFLMASGINLGTHTDSGFVNAQERAKKDLQTPKWKEQFQEVAENLSLTFLEQFLASEMARDGAMDIVRQCTVLTWSAFEMLCSDLFQHLINANPRLAARLLKNDQTKKLYQSKDLVSALEEHNYNLSATMGDVLLGQCRLDKLTTIRLIYDVLFTDNRELRDALNDAQLWYLYQVRNVIVHRASVVDKSFVANTGSKVPVGQRLRIVPGELKSFMVLVAHAGMVLLGTALAGTDTEPTAGHETNS